MQLRLTDDSIHTHARLLRRLQVPVIVLLIVAVPVIYAPQKADLEASSVVEVSTGTLPVSIDTNAVEDTSESPNSDFTIEDKTALPSEDTEGPGTQGYVADPAETSIAADPELENTTAHSVPPAADLSEHPHSRNTPDSDLQVGESNHDVHVFDQMGQMTQPIQQKIELVGEFKTTLVREVWKNTKLATEWIKKGEPAIVLPKPIVIRNSKSNRGSVAFLVDKEVKNLAPGEEYEIEGGSLHTVRFDRGGGFGQAKIELQDGIFEFQITEKGWDLATPAVE